MPRRPAFGRILVGAAATGAVAISLLSTNPRQQLPSAPVEAAATIGGAHKAKWVPTAQDALHLALAQVGTTEDADGGGTIYQKWFVSSPWAVRGVERDGGSIGDYADANWCDMFVSWVGDQLGVKGMGVDAFTPSHAHWFADRGRWGQTPTPGAVVFFSWSGSKDIDDIDHVGLVIKDNGDGTIETVEGNTDDSVEVRTRDVSNVVGYGYPDYAPAASSKQKDT